MGQPLEQQRHQVQFLDHAVLSADLHNTAIHRRRLIVLRHVIPGYQIDNHVRAFAVGRAFGLLDEVFFAVVNRHIGAQRQAGLTFFLRTDGGDHMGAERFRQQGGDGANA
ncbi:hypothetical protein D3C79_921900 [compost metagenome]